MRERYARISITIPREVFEKVEKKRGLVARSVFITQVLQKHFHEHFRERR